MTSVAVSAVALVPATFIASPAYATVIAGLTISSPVVNEGGTASFTVTYSGSAASANDIVFTTGGGTATNGGTDYTTNPTVPGGSGSPATTISAGGFTGTVANGGPNTIVVTVPTTADSSAEGPETFNLIATEANTTYVTTATATIVDSKVNNLTVTPASVWEGGTASFAVTYTGTTSSGSITFGTAGSAQTPTLTATRGTDFSATPSVASYTFPGTAAGGTNTITVTVDTTADGSSESDETFQLTAMSSTGTATGTGTIWEPANNPIVLSGATTVAETATGGVQQSVTVTATQVNPQPHDVVIPVKTADFAGTSYATDMATSAGGANRDYSALGSDATITIPANSTVGTTTVQLWDDNSDEQDTQYFNVAVDATRTVLGGAVVGGQDTVKIGIKDDDATPTVVAGDAAKVTEGAPLIFPLTLSNPSEKGANVSVAAAGVAAGSAAAATVGTTDSGTNDAVWTTSTVTFPAYAKTTNVLIPTTTRPSQFEGPENVRITMSSPVSATLGTPATGNGVITDTEAGQTLQYSSLHDPSGPGAFNNGTRSWTEGNSGPVEKKIYLKFNPTGNLPTTLNYTFADVTATNGVDYIGKAGSVSVAADGTLAEIPVTIVGDRIAEANETFNLVVTDPNNVASAASTGEILFTINDDPDSPPVWTTGDVTVAEGNSGTSLARIPVTLNAPAGADATFTAAFTPAGSAVDATTTTAGTNDFDAPTDSTVTVKAGSTKAYFEVPINGDTVYERDESFNVTFTPPGSVTASADTATVSKVTITNDDMQPKITFAAASGTEGGQVTVVPTVVGTSQYTYDVSFSAGAGTTDPATVDADFQIPATLSSPTVNIPVGFEGPLSKLPSPYTVPAFTLLNDDIDEPTETFTVTANEASAVLQGFTTSSTTVKIADDPLDTPPAASIGDVTVNEKDKMAELPVDLAFTGEATSTTQTVTIPYYTADGSAKAGKDYAPVTRGVLTVPPGTMKATVKVPIMDDPDMESDETFSVRLGTPQPVGAQVIGGEATVTIKSDDTKPPMAPTLMVTGPAKGAGSVMLSGKATPGTDVWLSGAALPEMDKKDFKKLGSVKADAMGNYKFPARMITSGWAFAVETSAGSTSVKTVKLTQAPMLTVSTTKGKLAATVGGNPKAAGQTVTIQRKSGSKWVTVGSGKTTSTGFRGSWSIKSGTKLTVRALVSGNAGMGINAGYSATKTITIK